MARIKKEVSNQDARWENLGWLVYYILGLLVRCWINFLLDQIEFKRV